MSKPRVVIIGVADWAGSAYQTCCAINSVGEFDCRSISCWRHPYEYPGDVVIPIFPRPDPRKQQGPAMFFDSVRAKEYPEAAGLLEGADLIHLWNTTPLGDGFLFSGLPINYAKTKVVTWTGTVYRDNHKDINRFSKELGIWKTVVQDPLFKIPDEVDATFIPHAVDMTSFHPLPFEERENWIGTYRVLYENYVRPSHKDMPKLHEIVNKHDGWRVELDYSMPHKERMEKLRQCSLFVLDISPYLASWGRSGLEACALGIPTLQNFSEECVEKTEGELGEFGFINIAWDTAEEKIGALIQDMEARKIAGEKARKWIEDYFSYPAVGKKYSEVYRSVL
jgi:hypothetical protein